LRLDRDWQEPVPLRPIFRDAFSVGGGDIARFERDRRGKITGFVLYAGRVRHHRFTAVSGAR
jgi:hypothetical protein